MKCPSCGFELDNSAKFCTDCGKDLSQKASIDEQPTPVATYVNNGQPQPEKKNNVVLIVILVVLGFLIMAGIIGSIFIKMIFKNIAKDVKNIEPDFTETSKFDHSRDGTLVKAIKDPTGHEIRIVEDAIYLYKVDTNYLDDNVREMRKKSKMYTQGDIEASNASTEQQEAMKLVLKEMNKYIVKGKKDIEDSLKVAKYSDETIKYAMENMGIDWREQANIYAINIMSSGNLGYSKNEVVERLKLQNYTIEEIDAAIDNENLDFYEQAVVDACFYKYSSTKYGSAYDRSKAQTLLEYNEYSKEEIEFALKTVYDEMS